jgi:hypothetical protein
MSSNDDSIKSSQPPDADLLPKDIIVFIGRGGCCYGHLIAIDRKGNLEYSVGTYHRSELNKSKSPEVLPEAFDMHSIEVDKRYAQEHQELPVEKIKEIALLMRDDEQLHFQDKELVDDDYLYQIFFDNKRIAYGYNSNLNDFPIKLRELINLVVNQTELHKLPGMA